LREALFGSNAFGTQRNQSATSALAIPLLLPCLSIVSHCARRYSVLTPATLNMDAWTENLLLVLRTSRLALRMRLRSYNNLCHTFNALSVCLFICVFPFCQVSDEDLTANGQGYNPNESRHLQTKSSRGNVFQSCHTQYSSTEPTCYRCEPIILHVRKEHVSLVSDMLIVSPDLANYTMSTRTIRELRIMASRHLS
jgi:hypothetical protein